MINKRKLEKLSLATLNEDCFAILLNKIPKKLKIRGVLLYLVLLMIWVSINLIPYSLFHKLGLAELKPTHMTIQLVDRPVKYPRGIIENVLVKIDKFISLNFVILDMDKDTKTPSHLRKTLFGHCES